VLLDEVHISVVNINAIKNTVSSSIGGFVLYHLGWEESVQLTQNKLKTIDVFSYQKS
jgi:hypothetical protein